MKTGSKIQVPESFLYAGSSALLISIAHLYPQYWPVALIALVPFLWRVISTNPRGAMIQGAMLATCYVLVVSPARPDWNPNAFLTTLLSLNLVFATFAVIVNRLKKYLGFNAVLVATLWLPLEYGLTHLTNLDSFFSLAAVDSDPILRIGSLFGLLMVSFAVVLVNFLLLFILTRVARMLSSRPVVAAAGTRVCRLPSDEVKPERWRGYSLMPRAPPSTARSTVSE